eukprot:CAMPEP_0203908704 /NCGR_PEP_ID=MMETSP0359-20131031/50103_1 /ASSEMBLY_ACC=CAM_ASM_000338 /TAXON_ID=268821 /ORGANISM="Scrippsiella Hangoei, Strain SHTV-5" /LENGTH=95 /DNA_ID=CAMNT_0050833781 /DNA_START=29 /DNA_END=312 /DNA_ORIENTATION=-
MAVEDEAAGQTDSEVVPVVSDPRVAAAPLEPTPPSGPSSGRPHSAKGATTVAAKPEATSDKEELPRDASAEELAPAPALAAAPAPTPATAQANAP